ncbi:hypothetical protein BS78_07G083900 [Paspalum vaginatum]|nr:hypothetical protein BS78_07G083900 [Paspalum vaginatum]
MEAAGGKASMSTGRRVRRVYCPNCGVLANQLTSGTSSNPGRVFYKCPYFSVGDASTISGRI